MPFKDKDYEREYRKMRATDPAVKAALKINSARSKAKNAEKKRISDKAYRAANREKRNEHNTKWRAENAEHYRAVVLHRNRANAGVINARTARRTAAKKQAIPKWADLAEIDRIYGVARWLTENSGEVWEVDHIVPLQGKTVCGLHCEANLDVVPRSDNRRKCNRYWPDMW